MRIVLSNASARWGGTHTVTEALARGLQARGHDVVVLCRPGSMLQERLLGVAPIEPILQGMDLSPTTLWRCRRALQRHEPDIVLTLMKKDVRLTAPVAKLMHIPVVVRHANEQRLHDNPYFRVLYGWAPAHHITNAEATRQTLLKSADWLHAEDITVIYNGIDLGRFKSAAPADLQLPAGALAIGYVGSFERRKGLADLAQAWPTIASASADAHLVLVGKGSQETRLRAQLDGAPRVRWLGYRTDIPAVMNALDLLVLPSHVEGAPNVVLEAMAAGVPVVATAVSGTPELVADRESGVLVAPGNTAQLTSAISELIANAPLRELMSAAATRRAREFDVHRMIDEYESLLYSIIAPED